MKNKLILFLTIVLILNITWEFSHYQLYNDLSSITGTPHLIIASFTDVLWVFLIYSIVSISRKNFSWINNPKKRDYILFVILSLIVALLIEVINIKLGRWSYKESMPTIYGIGLSPLIQLATTGVISLLISKHNKHIR